MVRDHSPEQLRRRLLEHLDREIAGMDPLPELTFTWDVNAKAASIRRLPNQRLRAEINLRAFGRGKAPSEFDLCFCACAVAEALRLWETAASERLDTYLHGLACVEVLGQSRTGRGSLFLPLRGEEFPRKFTTADLFCALSGMRRAQELCGGGSEALRERLEALAQVPEVVRCGRKPPESSFARCVRTVETLRGGDRLVPEELLTREDPLCRGIALRLMAFGEEPLPNLEAMKALEAELHSVRRRSVAFARHYGKAKDGYLRDELLALERLNAALNRMCARWGIPGQTGAIHPLTRG